MRRRLGLADFGELREAVFEARARGSWPKWDRYEIREGEVVAASDRVRGLTDADDEEWVSYDPISYDPIDDVPDLFLRFARLYSKSDFNKAALDFANRYGLPNGADADESPAPLGVPGYATDAKNWSLSQFHHEARRAWIILALYEAVLNDEDQTVRRLLSEHGEIEPFKDWLAILDMGSDEDQNLALALGLRCAVYAAEEVVHTYCRQQVMLSIDRDIRPSISYEADVYWTFDNLLGAMYLQMYWLMVSGGDITRCEHCGRIISLARPHPEGRKRRRDRRFCDDACRQAHHRSKKKA